MFRLRGFHGLGVCLQDDIEALAVVLFIYDVQEAEGLIIVLAVHLAVFVIISCMKIFIGRNRIFTRSTRGTISDRFDSRLWLNSFLVGCAAGVVLVGLMLHDSGLC